MTVPKAKPATVFRVDERSLIRRAITHTFPNHPGELPEQAPKFRGEFGRLPRLTEFAAEADLLELHWRVDLVAIETDENGTVLRLEHIRDIYPP